MNTEIFESKFNEYIEFSTGIIVSLIYLIILVLFLIYTKSYNFITK